MELRIVHDVLMGQQVNLHGEIQRNCSGQVGHELNGLGHDVMGQLSELGHNVPGHDVMEQLSELVHSELERGGVARDELEHGLQRLQGLERHEQVVRDGGLQLWHR